MKNAKKLLSVFLSALVTLTLFGFTSTKGVKADTIPAQLYYVNATDYNQTGNYWSNVGYIAVQKSSAQKNVVVHYTTDDGKTWNDLNAHYLKDNPSDGYELWSFNLNQAPNVTVRFAIRYDSNGTSYLDDNNGKNYTLGLAPGTFGKSQLFAEGVIPYNNSNGSGVDGSIILHNLSGDKVVTIRYSYDNWATYSETQASYFDTSCDHDAQRWIFHTAPNASAKQISFAVRYTINGVNYWDNNFGSNYNLNLN